MRHHLSSIYSKLHPTMLRKKKKIQNLLCLPSAKISYYKSFPSSLSALALGRACTKVNCTVKRPLDECINPGRQQRKPQTSWRDKCVLKNNHNCGYKIIKPKLLIFKSNYFHTSRKGSLNSRTSNSHSTDEDCQWDASK